MRPVRAPVPRGHAPSFGKPTKEQLATAQAVVRDHFAEQITGGVFDDWAS